VYIFAKLTSQFSMRIQIKASFFLLFGAVQKASSKNQKPFTISIKSKVMEEKDFIQSK